MSETPEPSASGAPAATTTRDRVLVAVFWAWAAVLVVATLAQLFRWQGVLDVLDVKNWFAR
jgi:hypothetical protein